MAQTHNHTKMNKQFQYDVLIILLIPKPHKENRNLEILYNILDLIG